MSAAIVREIQEQVQALVLDISEINQENTDKQARITLIQEEAEERVATLNAEIAANTERVEELEARIEQMEALKLQAASIVPNDGNIIHTSSTTV